ncbi:HTH-type transcriptional regulator / antitoxin HigA [Gammaproteobacteria bacterium]
MTSYRTIGEVEEKYLRDHPSEVDDYVTVLFEEYAENGDTAALMSSLRVVSRIKGVSRIAEDSSLSRKGVQKALSENGHPQFESVNAILHAMGFRLAPQKLDSSIPIHAIGRTQ